MEKNGKFSRSRQRAAQEVGDDIDSGGPCSGEGAGTISNGQVSTTVTFGGYRFWRAYIDGYSALGVVYEVSLEVVMTTRA